MTFGDAGAEMSNIAGSSAVIDDENVETETALFDTFRGRVEALALGDPVKRVFINTVEQGFTRPTNGANRETKLLVQYQHLTSGKRYTMTLPTLNPTIPVYVDNINAKDVVRMDTPAAISNFVTAFNAFVKAPDIPLAMVEDFGNTVVVVGLKVVGRNI